MDHTNYTQDHSVDFQKLPQNQEFLLWFEIYSMIVILVVIFLVKCAASDKKVDFSDPEDILLDPKERAIEQNLRSAGML